MVINPLSFRVDLLVICVAVIVLIALLVVVGVEAAVLEGALTLSLAEEAAWDLAEHTFVVLD